VDYPYQCNAHL